MGKKSDKLFNKIEAVVNQYYILPQKTIDMQRISFYKQELLAKIYDLLQRNP